MFTNGQSESKRNSVSGVRSSAPLHLGVIAIEKEAFGSPSTTVANFTFIEATVQHFGYYATGNLFWVLSRSLIEKFKIYSYLILPWAKKFLRKSYTKNLNMGAIP